MNTIALSFACVAAATLPPTDGPTAAASGVRKFLAEWAEGWRDGRVDRMLSFYGDSETVAAVESRGILRTGLPEIRKMYEEAFGELIFEKVELKPEVVSESADAAWAICRYKADVRTRADNRRYVLEVRGSFVLQRSGDEWRIALEHFSTIEGVPRARRAGIGGGRRSAAMWSRGWLPSRLEDFLEHLEAVYCHSQSSWSQSDRLGGASSMSESSPRSAIF